MTDEQKHREEICDIGRRLYENNLIAAGAGNISVRIGAGRFLCTPTMVSKGFMKPEDLAVVDEAGEQISGPTPRSSEVLLHLAIYRELPQVGAVVHAHPPHATAFAVVGRKFLSGILPEVEIFLGKVPIAAYDTPGGEALAETIRPHIHNDANAVLLANHGAVAFDETLQKAYFHIEMLEQYCHTLTIAQQLGQPRQIPVEKMAELKEIRRKMKG